MPALIDVEPLRSFVAIADYGSFTRAAAVVHKTQSAVSMQIKRLEEQVGRALFEREGRACKLTEDGERLLDYARRIVRLNEEALLAFRPSSLTGRVRLGVPDDYADRYLPEILARFARSNPRVEVTVTCEPSPNLAGRIESGDLDLAIVTQVDRRGPLEVFRQERLLWVTSARHAIFEASPVPLALGLPTCNWRTAAIEALEAQGRAHRVLYTSWSWTAMGAVVLAGLAVSVMAESSVRPGMRALGPAEGYPALPSCKVGLLRARGSGAAPAEALAAMARAMTSASAATSTAAASRPPVDGSAIVKLPSAPTLAPAPLLSVNPMVCPACHGLRFLAARPCPDGEARPHGPAAALPTRQDPR